MSRYRTPLIWLTGFVCFALFIIWNRDFTTFVNYLQLALPQGAVIALIAVGYSMVYGIIQLINFAHGEVFMFAAFFTLMFVMPGAQSPAGAMAIALMVGACMACTLWVVLGTWFRDRKVIRATGAAVVGVLGAAGVRALLPTEVGQATIPFFAAYALAVVFSCCLGVTMDVVAYRPLRSAPRLIPLITAIAVSFFLQNVAQAIWEARPRSFPRGIEPAWFSYRQSGLVPGAATVSNLDMAIIGLAFVLLAGLVALIHFTRTGRALRACAEDRHVAALMGIHPDRCVALAFALGAGLAALVAPLYVLRGTFISPTMGYIVGILAFSSAVLGGIGNITGAMLGGLIIGIIYSFVPLFDAFDQFRMFKIMEGWGWVTKEGFNSLANNLGRPGQYQLGVAYAFMIVVIIFRPTGLLGKASAKRA